MMLTAGQRRGFSLAEVVVAVALVAALGLAAMTLISGGAQVGARAGEMQMATMVGARVMDRMVALGFAGLESRARRAGPDGVLDLASLERSRRGPWAGLQVAEVRSLAVDGYEYSGRYSLEPAAPGLLRVRVMISWERAGFVALRHPGSLVLMRYVADPLAGLGEAVP